MCSCSVEGGNLPPVPVLSPIALWTDFGLRDPFVGVLHAVIMKLAPHARILDACHHIPPQDCAAASFWLERCAEYFPAGTVHLCVVDPGVGTERAVIACRTAQAVFIAPDNGCLPRAALAAECRRVTDTVRFTDAPLSRTFHGRDLLAPLAAKMARGDLPFEQLGPSHEPVPAAFEPAQRSGNLVSGRVLTIDHYGNLLTNIDTAHVQGARALVRIGDQELPLVAAYAAARPSALLAIGNAHGVIEIAQRNGNAAQTLGIGVGAPVAMQLD